MSALSTARKKANQKWDKENMATVACHLRREQADEFKRIALERGTSANQILKEYILTIIEQNAKRENP